MERNDEIDFLVHSLIKEVDNNEKQFINKGDSIQVGRHQEKNTFTENFQQKQEIREKKRKTNDEASIKIRADADQCWIDRTLSEWPLNDYRIYVGNLSNTTTDQDLQNTFSKFKSLAHVKVIKDTSGRSKQYGFISLLDKNDYIECMKKMERCSINGKNVLLKPSIWDKKNVE